MKFEEICKHITGSSPSGIIIQSGDWSYIARRLMSAWAACSNMPDWIINPTEGLESLEKTPDGFKEFCKAETEPTLQDLYEYIFEEDKDEVDINRDTKWENRVYREFSKAIAKSYLGSWNYRYSPQAFLQGKATINYRDLSTFDKFKAVIRNESKPFEGAFIE